MTRARVYTPPPDTPAYRTAPDDLEPSRQWLVLTIMIIVLVTSGYVLWSLYGEAPQADGTQTIAAESARFKEPYEGPPIDELATAELDQALAAKAAPALAAPTARTEAPVTEVAAPAAPAKPKAAAAPKGAGAGDFVVQIAALRSPAAADAAWERLARRDAALFAGVTKEIQTADLGGKGVYHRVRAGYFAERADAARFCDRVKTLGQECIVMVR